MKFRTWLIYLTLLLTSYQSVADILITPTRVVFNDRDRVQEVILVNTSNESRTYALSWVELKQLDNLSYQKMNEEELTNYNAASKYIRFSPRRLTLQPGENQRVKLMLRRSSDAKGKDFRSHLKFTVIPNEVLKDNSEQEAKQLDGPAVKLNLFLNYTIPVLIKGNVESAEVEINNVVFKANSDVSNDPLISYTFKKPLGMSAFGDVTGYFKAHGSEEYVPIGYNNNVSLYHETAVAKGYIVWTEKVALGSGLIKVVYKGKEETADISYTEAVLRINKNDY